jgi:hypothetical protein
MFTADAQQHNARYGALPTKDKIAEIFVLGKEQSHLTRRERNNIRVAQTRNSFGDIEHVVTSAAQKPNQVGRDAFISEPSHASTVDDFFVGEIVGGKCLRGADIVKRQPWVVHEDCFRRDTGAEFAQDKLYGNACATNDRFAVHDTRIYFDALILHGILFDRFLSQGIIGDGVCQRP